MKSAALFFIALFIFPFAKADPVTSTTLEEFRNFCTGLSQQHAVDSCGSYINGSLDQIALNSKSEKCAIDLDNNTNRIRVLLQVFDDAKKEQFKKELLWRGLKRIASDISPSC